MLVFPSTGKNVFFFATETEYLGTIVENGVIKPGTRKVEALTKTLAPTDLKGVRQFIGLAGYFKRFIKGFSLLTAPISQLLRKNVRSRENSKRDNPKINNSTNIKNI